MKSVAACFLVIFMGFVPSFSLYGGESNWDRTSALQSISEINTQATLEPLFELVRTGKNSALLNALSAVDQDRGIPAPVRDYIVFSFTHSLSDQAPGTVSLQVLDYLSNYQPHTLVAHDDHPRMATPLFNVRAATAGVRNRWARQQASIRAEGLLQEQPDQWISTYLEASPAERRGFVDALDFASIEQLSRLGWSALPFLDEQPELTLVAARGGMISDDFELLRRAISRGGGPGLPKALAAVSPGLSNDEAADLLGSALRSGSDTRAALAIAQLAPGRLRDPAISELLFDALAHQNLGAAAALVLGSSHDPDIQARLNEIALGKASLSQQRAELAISTMHADQEAGQ